MVSTKRSANLFRLFSEPKLTEGSRHLMLDNRCGRDQLLSKPNDGSAAYDSYQALNKPTKPGSLSRNHGASKMRTSHRMRPFAGVTNPQAPMMTKMATVVSNKMAAVSVMVTLSLLHCLLLPRVEAGALKVPIQEGYQMQQVKMSGGLPIDFSSEALHLPKPLNQQNPLFWFMRGKKTQTPTTFSNQEGDDQDYPDMETENVNTSKNEISHLKQSRIEKREIKGASNWGSNPYLLGKRPYGLPYLFVSPQKYYGSDDGDDSSVVLPGDEIALSNGLSHVMQSGKRRDGLFWASRGKRGDEVTDGISTEFPMGVSTKRAAGAKYSPAQIKEAMKNSGSDNSKFWMTRGRRFWAARGKKEAAESVLNRLAHLVGPELKNKAFLYGLDHEIEAVPESETGIDLVDVQNDQAVVEQPYFWVVRGKKSDSSLDGEVGSIDLYDDGEDSSPYSTLLYRPDDLRAKKAFNKFSALARLNAKGLNTPNFWASRGRKNFWAARGKRSPQAADRP